jgi:hypothetical protein
MYGQSFKGSVPRLLISSDMRSFTSNSSVPFSDQASRAFGSSRPSKSPKTEFSDSARSAFHSKRSDPPPSTHFPKAFGGDRGGPSRSEFSDTASAAFGGGRRHDYSDQASSAFGGAGGSRDFHPAFGKKERRPLVSEPPPPPVALTPAERLIAEAKGKTTWGNSALSTAPTTIADVLKSDELFPTLGATKGGAKPSAAAVAATVAPTKAPTLAEKAKVWSSQHEVKRQAEQNLREREALRRAIDEREVQILKSIHAHHPLRKAPISTEDDAFEEPEYVEDLDAEAEPEHEYEEDEDYN